MRELVEEDEQKHCCMQCNAGNSRCRVYMYMYTGFLGETYMLDLGEFSSRSAWMVRKGGVDCGPHSYLTFSLHHRVGKLLTAFVEQLQILLNELDGE